MQQNPERIRHLRIAAGAFTSLCHVALRHKLGGAQIRTDQYALGTIWAAERTFLLELDQNSSPGQCSVSPDQEAMASTTHGTILFPIARRPGRLDSVHANPKSSQGCGAHRNPQAQRFKWTKDSLLAFHFRPQLRRRALPPRINSMAREATSPGPSESPSVGQSSAPPRALPRRTV